MGKEEEEKRAAIFGRYGYSTLIIWASEFGKDKQMVKDKISSFIENHK